MPVQAEAETHAPHEINDKIASFKEIHEGIISTNDSNIDVYVVPTNEELMIAIDTYELIK
jgi:acetate kinase